MLDFLDRWSFQVGHAIDQADKNRPWDDDEHSKVATAMLEEL